MNLERQIATVFLVEGPVGAGKSTFAAQLGLTHAAPRLILDEWMVTLFRPDRPNIDLMQWYGERKQRCIEQIWRVTCDLIDTGTSAVLELGLVQCHARLDFYARIDAAEYPLRVYVLDAPRAVRRARVHARNHAQSGTFQMVVPDEMFESASDLWEPPDDLEIERRDIEFVSTARV